jgi:hypothetical protein
VLEFAERAQHPDRGSQSERADQLDRHANTGPGGDRRVDPDQGRHPGCVGAERLLPPFSNVGAAQRQDFEFAFRRHVDNL